MKIVLLNGNSDEANRKFDTYLKTLSGQLAESGHQISLLKLRDLKIEYCIGCWGCWVKTPGECAVKDDSEMIRREYIQADWVVFASPIILGFTSALLKKVNDKIIPILLPYIQIVENECHHFARYPKYPQFGLLLQKEKATDTEDLEIIRDIYRRDALNMKTTLGFMKFVDDPIEEVLHEINHL